MVKLSHIINADLRFGVLLRFIVQVQLGIKVQGDNVGMLAGGDCETGTTLAARRLRVIAI
jgi:hypothetical protein